MATTTTDSEANDQVAEALNDLEGSVRYLITMTTAMGIVLLLFFAIQAVVVIAQIIQRWTKKRVEPPLSKGHKHKRVKNRQSKKLKKSGRKSKSKSGKSTRSKSGKSSKSTSSKIKKNSSNKDKSQSASISKKSSKSRSGTQPTCEPENDTSSKKVVFLNKCKESVCANAKMLGESIQGSQSLLKNVQVMPLPDSQSSRQAVDVSQPVPVPTIKTTDSLHLPVTLTPLTPVLTSNVGPSLVLSSSSTPDATPSTSGVLVCPSKISSSGVSTLAGNTGTFSVVMNP